MTVELVLFLFAVLCQLGELGTTGFLMIRERNIRHVTEEEREHQKRMLQREALGKVAWLGIVLVTWLLQILMYILRVMCPEIGESTVGALSALQAVADFGGDGVCLYIIWTQLIGVVANLCLLDPVLMDSPIGKMLITSNRGETAEKYIEVVEKEKDRRKNDKTL